jgi:hypothetical protein
MKEIDDSAFSDSGIKIIGIPNNVENIGNKCFYECRSLCEIVFESDSKLKEIGDSAFRDLGIKIIPIPNHVEKIGNECFYEGESPCEVVFERDSKFKEIDDSAFSDSGVKTMEIPDKYESLNWNSLFGLNFVTISNRNKSLMFKDNYLVKDKGNTLIRYFWEVKQNFN